jgi:hypothetical protein
MFGTDGFEIDPDMPFLNWVELSSIEIRSAAGLGGCGNGHDAGQRNYP